jgi:hypothetical protein
VACESTYSQPGPEGEVDYHDGTKATDVAVLYRLPDDWLFVNSVEAYQWSRERRAERLAQTPLDVREILYGAPLLNFIIDECWQIEIPESDTNGNGTRDVSNSIASTSSSIVSTSGSIMGTARSVVAAFDPIADPDEPNPDVSTALPEADDEEEDAVAKQISAIHARWLITPREDLRGQSPRDVMFAKQDFIDFDLHTRSLQWTFLDEGPPCLSTDSFAYRYAGFGTHEWVIYYDLVRHLLWSAPTLWSGSSLLSATTGRGFGPGDLSPDATHEPALPQDRDTPRDHPPSPQIRDVLLAQLDKVKSDWLDQPLSDYDGRIPAILIDNERKRLPIALRPRDMIVDENCPMCQMFGDETSPLGMGVGFWHLDGCNMDDDFAFSHYRTREEWEAENLRREEFTKEFDRKWKARQERIARGEEPEPDPFFDLDPFPGLAFDDSSLPSDESIEDPEKEASN